MGHIQRQLAPPNAASEYKLKTETSEDNDDYETHRKICEKDLVHGIVVMNILPRLRYLLENSEEITSQNYCLDIIYRVIIFFFLFVFIFCLFVFGYLFLL